PRPRSRQAGWEAPPPPARPRLDRRGGCEPNLCPSSPEKSRQCRERGFRQTARALHARAAPADSFPCPRKRLEFTLKQAVRSSFHEPLIVEKKRRARSLRVYLLRRKANVTGPQAVPLLRLERRTFHLGRGRSIQLSYRGLYRQYIRTRPEVQPWSCCGAKPCQSTSHPNGQPTL